LHEIRSLGGALQREAGWTVSQVQTLMTHTSEAMTEHYLGGHEAPWTEVQTGVKLARIGRNREAAGILYTSRRLTD
jgi:enterobacteria phage integrase